LFSAICLGNCYRMPFAALLGERLESTQFPMTEQIALCASSFPQFVIEIASFCLSPRFWAKGWNQRNFL